MTNKAELLLEIGCEEIPADQVLMAVSSIQKKLEAFFLEARLSFETSKVCCLYRGSDEARRHSLRSIWPTRESGIS